jgi:hypothetical protein
MAFNASSVRFVAERLSGSAEAPAALSPFLPDVALLRRMR